MTLKELHPFTESNKTKRSKTSFNENARSHSRNLIQSELRRLLFESLCHLFPRTSIPLWFFPLWWREQSPDNRAGMFVGLRQIFHVPRCGGVLSRLFLWKCPGYVGNESLYFLLMKATFESWFLGFWGVEGFCYECCLMVNVAWKKVSRWQYNEKFLFEFKTFSLTVKCYMTVWDKWMNSTVTRSTISWVDINK